MASCRFLEPSYLELTPYVQRGENSFDRPVSNFDEETWGVQFTLGWLVGVQYEAMNNLSKLDVSRSGQLTMREDAPAAVAPIEINVDHPAAEAEEASGLAALTAKPKTEEDARIFLYWTLGLLSVGAAGLLAKKLGVPIPFLPKNTPPPEE